jgi:hypothetical protein
MAYKPVGVPIFPYQPQTSRVQIANADAQNYKTIFTAGGNGSKVFALFAASSDTSARVLQVAITNSGTNYPLCTVNVPASSGTSSSGSTPVNLLSTATIPGIPIDSDGNPFLYLISGDTLTVSALTTVTSADAITVHAVAADF